MASPGPNSDLPTDGQGGLLSETSPDYRLIVSPEPWQRPAGSKVPALFLAGSIERGQSDWRNVLARELRPYPVTVLNPHRTDWDSSWREDITFQPFREQVEWELDMIERADIAAVYFATQTLAPITLMELGLMAKKNSQSIKVCCPEKYGKRGNVQIVCAKYKLELFDTVADLIQAVIKCLQEQQKQDTTAAIHEESQK